MRLKSISMQLQSLYQRLYLVKMQWFVIQPEWQLLLSHRFGSGLIDNDQNRIYQFWHSIVDLFVIGMIIVLAGVIFAARESIKGFQIVGFELKADE
ncbi:MAG: hypothetical protein IPN18_13640 [Ignavibacteriales bacterium]|nr:hypothetical protein [Ignavibacteriales bacterium]